MRFQDQIRPCQALRVTGFRGEVRSVLEYRNPERRVRARQRRNFDIPDRGTHIFNKNYLLYNYS